MGRVDENMTRVSKAMAKFLRHAPEEIGITLDENGWTDLETLITKMRAKGLSVNENMLRTIVKKDVKGRYAISETINPTDGKPLSLIRANQGHSTKKVDLKFTKAAPPALLYHGTTVERWNKIRKSGAMLPMSRQYVHLTADLELAKKGAQRWRGEHPQVLVIDAEQMAKDNIEFNVSDNLVWLVRTVPVQYISELTSEVLLLKNV